MSLPAVLWYDRVENPSGPPMAERIEPVENRSAYMNKPYGGLWTSPVDSEYDWATWCRENEMAWLGAAYRLEIAEPPALLVIQSRPKLEWAFTRYPLVGQLGPYEERGLDYARIAEDYDGVWLTAEGFWSTRMDSLSLTTYGWDCETVLWFRWCFSEVTAEVAA